MGVTDKISGYLEITGASKRKRIPIRGGKKSGKKTSTKKPATKKEADAFHSDMKGKLDKLAEQYGVKIRVVKKVRKMPSIVVSGLKSKPFGEIAKLFKSISNSSPVPQKMDSNKAMFVLFGPRGSKAKKRKTTASDAIASNVRRNAKIKMVAEGEGDEKLIAGIIRVVEERKLDLLPLINSVLEDFNEGMKESELADQVQFLVDVMGAEGAREAVKELLEGGDGILDDEESGEGEEGSDVEDSGEAHNDYDGGDDDGDHEYR